MRSYEGPFATELDNFDGCSRFDELAVGNHIEVAIAESGFSGWPQCGLGDPEFTHR